MSANQIKICIPSYKRAECVKTLDSIPLAYARNVYLYVRDNEVEAYSRYSNRCQIIALPSHVSNIGETRKAIIDHQGVNRIWMLDDDLDFCKSYISAPNYKGDTFVRPFSKKMPKFADSDFMELLAYINNLIDDGFAHGCVQNAGLARKGHVYPMRVNHYGYTNTFLDLSTIPKSLIVYNDYTLLEDLAQWLTLVTNGYDSAKIYSFLTRDISNTSNAEKRDLGGCYETRTSIATNECAQRLLREFPDYIQMRTSSIGTLAMIDGNDQTRIRVQPRVPRAKHTAIMRNRFPEYVMKANP